MYFGKAKRISKNKFLEVEITWRDSWYYCSISVEWSAKMDHAGPKFSLSIYKFGFDIGIYDHRHWDYEINGFEKCTPENCNLIKGPK